MGKFRIQNSEFQNPFQRSLAFSVFRTSKPGSPNIKVVPNYLEHTLENFKLKPNSFDTVLVQLDLGTRRSDTGTLVTLQLPVPSQRPYTKDKAMSDKQILHIDLAQIFEDLRPISVRTWAEATVPRVRPWLTPLVHARSRTRAPQRPPARARRSLVACELRRAYLAAQSLGHPSPHAHKSCPSQRSPKFAPSTPRHHPPSFPSLGRRDQLPPVTPKSHQTLG
jgi:hypothetical protein